MEAGVGVRDVPTPSVARRRLRAALVSARQAAGLKQEQVAAAMEWSLSKVIRIEKGPTRITTNDLRPLLRLYKVTNPDRVEELVAIAKAARERSWWDSYKPLLADEVIEYFDYEAAASVVRNFQPLVVPGLLQTEEYARAMIPQTAGLPESSRIDSQAKLVKIRMGRQELLDQTDAPRLFFILDEPVIRRLVGTTELMRRQVLHLIDAASKPQLTIQVLPFTAGLTFGMDGPFVILELPGPPDEHVVYLESARGHFIRQSEAEISSYREAFERLRKLALNPSDSVGYMSEIASDWKA